MKRFQLASLLLVMSLYACGLSAQQWNAYTLYSLTNSNTVRLVDTTGATFHTWTMTNAGTGYSTYMEPGGTIVRTVRTNNPAFQGGGLHGRVQKVDWNGTVTWDWTHSASNYILHHDHHVLPNGNVLLIAYENKTAVEVFAAGAFFSSTVQSEKVIEVEPTGPTTGNIVWEWHLWDHLVQNVDSSRDNYQTSISAHPELMNINFELQRDWHHMNGIDYNEATDQILLSSHNTNEIYVIDHSTTTAEAASHSGGNAGMGGDFLYRWGNPRAYDAGTNGDEILKVCHDAHWIPNNCPRAGWMGAFNNDGISPQQSCVDLIIPPVNGLLFDLNPGPAYSPGSYDFRQPCNGRTSNMGNSEQLPNGNMLICMATLGTIYEIDPGGNLLWTKQSSGFVPQAHSYTLCHINGDTAPDVIAVASLDTVCPNTSVNLDAFAIGPGSYTYKWSSYPYGFSSTAQTPTATPAVTTTYFVTITEAGGCFGVNSVEVVVAGSATPTITASNDTLFATTAASYQWFYNGVAIPGATGNYHVPTQNGGYTVQTADAAGCLSAISANYNHAPLSIASGFEEGWKVYPNPSNGQVFIQAPEGIESYSVSVADAVGKRLTFALNPQSLDLSSLNSGMYFISIFKGDQRVSTQKITLKH